MTSNLRVYAFGTILLSVLLISNFNFYTNLNNNYGGSLTDYSDINGSSNIFGYITEVQNKAKDIQETDIGGFKVILGGLNVASSLLDIASLFTGILGTLSDIIGIPVWATSLLLLEISLTLLISFYNIVWGRHKA